MNFINKINKYLLEHYPLIWNTRLVWMLGVNVVVHLLFFIIGFASVNGLDDLKEFNKLNDFFYDTSNVYYNILISIFILLIWFVFYLRNNAFKNLYSVKKGMLFQQYCIIFLIIIISTTQFYSFKKGLKTRVKSLYGWQEVDKDIKTFNKASLFLMQSQNDYEIDEKKYPYPFPLKIAKQHNRNKFDNIDTTRAYLKYRSAYYQFYKIDERLYKIDADKESYVNDHTKNDFKYRIVEDVSAFKELLNPSLLNYSKEKFSFGQDSLAYKQQLDYHKKILTGKNDFEIKEQLKVFLTLANKYNAEHNLEVEKWFELIDNKPNYLLKKLINTSNPRLDDFNNVKYNRSNSSTTTNSISHSKTLFFSFNNTDNFFNNVHASYFSDFDIELLYFLIVFSIILSILILIFKTTDIKTLLLSFVAGLVVLVLIVWLMSSSRNLFGYSQNVENHIMLMISFIVFLFSIFSYKLRWKKIIISISWSLALFAVPLFFLFASISYSKYLKDVYYETYDRNYGYKSAFETWFDSYGFFAITCITILTVYIYSLFIRRLKARAE